MTRLRIGGGAALCAAGAIALTTLTTGALAQASTPPDVTGKPYSDAKSTLSDAGFTPVVSTTVGDQKEWPDCLVTNVQARSEAAAPNSSGTATNEALVSLNCYSAEASNKGAGYSAASPEGRTLAEAAKEKAAKDKAAAEAAAKS